MGQSRADWDVLAEGAPQNQRAAADGYSPADFPELDCLRNLLPPDVLAAAAHRAVLVDTGADQVLIAQGIISESEYLRHFSLRSGIQLAVAAVVTAAAIDLADADLRSAAECGHLKVRIDGRSIVIATLRDKRARVFEQIASRAPRELRNLRLAPEDVFRDLLLYRSNGVTRHAIYGLHDRHPALSAAPTIRHRWLRIARLCVISPSLILIAAAAVYWVPGPMGTLLALVFIAAIMLRLAASLCRPKPTAPKHFEDAELPSYTVIAALYHETASIPRLLKALLALDYPPEKLDIILAVETDDLATRAAIARERPPSNVRVIVAPDQGPRTKPKALNVALPFARGAFVAVYDAEDQPDRNQLRIALAAFEQGGDDLACVQARLAIRNSGDSFFTRMFAAEYAGQFDIAMPGYDRLGFPWPLGGTSNHFRTALLREVGAWDPFNVTEDADLGLRFARFQYRTATIYSTTWEEAVIGPKAWINQRTRWMKGWMQTWWVHARNPRRYWRRTRWPGWLARDLLIGGALLAALAYPLVPFLLCWMAWELLAEGKLVQTAGVLSPLHLTCFLSGWAVSAFIQLRGLTHRGLLRHAWVLLLTPVYWGLLSYAAWRAVRQLHTDPHHWEKTEHGLSKTTDAAKDTASDPLPLLQASA